MKPLKVRISITLDDPIYQRIKGLAEYDDRSVSSYINLALRDHLNQLDREAREWEKRRECPRRFLYSQAFSFCHSPTASSSQRLL